MSKSFTCRTRVRYGETDKMGVAYYGRYVDWFEMGRTELCRSQGKTYIEWENEGIMLPVVETHVRYKSSLRYDDLIEVETSITDLTRVSVVFTCRVFRIDESTGKRAALAAEGYTRHAFVSSTDGKLIRKGNALEAWLRDAINN